MAPKTNYNYTNARDLYMQLLFIVSFQCAYAAHRGLLGIERNYKIDIPDIILECSLLGTPAVGH